MMVSTAVPVIPPDLRPMVPARRRPFATVGPQRPLPPRHQPQQPPEAPARPRAPEIIVNNEKRMPRRRSTLFDNAAVVVPSPAGQPSEVAVGHAEGQAGPVPPEPARQARRLLRPLGHRRRPQLAAPVRPAQKADGARALLPFVMKRLVDANHAQNIKAAKRMVDAVARGVGRARGGHPRAPGVAQPRAHPAPPRHPGVSSRCSSRARPSRSTRSSARVQRRLRRRPDGRPPAAVSGGPGRGPHPHAVEQQHPVAGARSPAGHAHPGHGARCLLPHRPSRRPEGGRVFRRPPRRGRAQDSSDIRASRPR